MAEAKNGDTVSVHYTGKFEDGTVFDSSSGKDPLQVELGGGQVIPGFEEALVGMNPGEKKSIDIPVEKAYGPRNEQLIATVDRKMFPEESQPTAGQRYQIEQSNGQKVIALVTEVNDNEVTLDANHPLAGKALSFDLELVEIL